MNNDQFLTFLNQAQREDLITLPGVGPALADRLISSRPFDSLDSVTSVKGISADLLEKCSAALSSADRQHPRAGLSVRRNLVSRISDLGKKTLEGFSDFGDAVGKRGQAVPQAVEALPEKLEVVPKAQGPLGRILLGSGLTALVAVLVTLIILGSINGSLKYSTGAQYLTMQREITQMSSRIDSLEENLNGLRTRISTLEGLGERTAELEITQEQLASELAVTNQKVADLQAELSDLDQEVSRFDDQAQRFESFLSNLNILLGSLFPSPGE